MLVLGKLNAICYNVIYQVESVCKSEYFFSFQNCRVSEQCTVRGLHAHHPRDCYFYLRDQDAADLQKLLRDNDVAYNTDPPEAQGKLFLNIIFSLTHCLRKNIPYCRMLYSFKTLLRDHAR